MKLLFLSRWFPYPPNNGSKIRVFNLLKQLARRHEVALVSFGDRGDAANARALAILGEYCSSVRVLPYRGFRPSSARSLLGLLSPQPRSLVDTFSADMRCAVVEQFGDGRYDLVVASQLDMVPYALALPGVPALLEELELSTYLDAASKETSLPRRVRALLTWVKLSAYLRRTLPRFATCTVVSERERANLKRVAPWYTSVEIVPNALELSEYDGGYGPPHPDTLVFCGALTYSANYDAVRHFLGTAYPLITRVLPGVLLRVTGDNTGVDPASLPRCTGVEYTGYVPDVRPVVAESWASVVPLRMGGGTRLKILESMALDTPVVSTSKGAEGLEVTDGEDILIADDPGLFAEKTVALLRSDALRSRLAAGARHLVESKYDWNLVGATLLDLVDRAAAGRASPVGVGGRGDRIGVRP